MARLWLTLGEMYPGTWGNQMGEVGGHAYKTWVSALSDLKAGQLKRGLERCVREGGNWPPSLPQFRKWCNATPEDLGLLPEYLAFKEAADHAAAPADHQWSHPAVYVAARESGFYNLRTMPTTQASKIFGQCYAHVCRLVMEGSDFSGEIPKALPAPDDVFMPSSPEVVRANINEIKKKLNGGGC